MQIQGDLIFLMVEFIVSLSPLGTPKVTPTALTPCLHRFVCGHKCNVKQVFPTIKYIA